MRPAAVLLSSFLATLRLSSRTYFSILLILLSFSEISYSQTDSIPIQSDSSKYKVEYTIRREPRAIPGSYSLMNEKYASLTPQQKKTRTWIIGTGNMVGYGGIMALLASTWYSKYSKTKFHSFNDSREWQQMDKAGHYYGTWIESRANHELWKWTGMERKKRIWISGLTSFAFQTTIEYLDGRSAEWGWSWADFGTNILGSGTFIAQELAWDEQRIKLKWSFHRKSYSDPMLNQRSDELFGKSSPERFLKDYNGQTYWASASIKSFFAKSKLPAWLCVAVGYGADGMFGGEENIAKDENGVVTFDRRDIKRYRQWYLAPDIDLSKVKTKSKAVNFMLTVLSAFKFPAPSLEYSNGKFRLNAIHF